MFGIATHFQRRVIQEFSEEVLLHQESFTGKVEVYDDIFALNSGAEATRSGTGVFLYSTGLNGGRGCAFVASCAHVHTSGSSPGEGEKAVCTIEMRDHQLHPMHNLFSSFNGVDVALYAVDLTPELDKMLGRTEGFLFRGVREASSVVLCEAAFSCGYPSRSGVAISTEGTVTSKHIEPFFTEDTQGTMPTLKALGPHPGKSGGSVIDKNGYLFGLIVGGQVDEYGPVSGGGNVICMNYLNWILARLLSGYEQVLDRDGDGGADHFKASVRQFREKMEALQASLNLDGLQGFVAKHCAQEQASIALGKTMFGRVPNDYSRNVERIVRDLVQRRNPRLLAMASYAFSSQGHDRLSTGGAASTPAAALGTLHRSNSGNSTSDSIMERCQRQATASPFSFNRSTMRGTASSSAAASTRFTLGSSTDGTTARLPSSLASPGTYNRLTSANFTAVSSSMGRNQHRPTASATIFDRATMGGTDSSQLPQRVRLGLMSALSERFETMSPEELASFFEYLKNDEASLGQIVQQHRTARMANMASISEDHENLMEGLDLWLLLDEIAREMFMEDFRRHPTFHHLLPSISTSVLPPPANNATPVISRDVDPRSLLPRSATGGALGSTLMPSNISTSIEPTNSRFATPASKKNAKKTPKSSTIRGFKSRSDYNSHRYRWNLMQEEPEDTDEDSKKGNGKGKGKQGKGKGKGGKSDDDEGMSDEAKESDHICTLLKMVAIWSHPETKKSAGGINREDLIKLEVFIADADKCGPAFALAHSLSIKLRKGNKGALVETPTSSVPNFLEGVFKHIRLNCKSLVKMPKEKITGVQKAYNDPKNHCMVFDEDTGEVDTKAEDRKYEDWRDAACEAIEKIKAMVSDHLSESTKVPDSKALEILTRSVTYVFRSDKKFACVPGIDEVASKVAVRLWAVYIRYWDQNQKNKEDDSETEE